jgi:hypothetical protein
MFGAMPLIILVARNIMSVLLMISAILLEFICFAANLKYLNPFMNFSSLLSICLIEKTMLVSMKTESIFCSVGISHLVSCPHTHQQNGVVECKHYHIVEMSLSLLAIVSMPLKY